MIALGALVLVFIAIVVVTMIATQGAILTGGVPIGSVSFSDGDIPGFPVYPEAEQSLETGNISIPDDMRRVIGTREDDWKRYLSNASPQEILTWYDQALEAAGFEKGSPRESGILVFPQGDMRYALYIVVVDGQANIIAAVGRE